MLGGNRVLSIDNADNFLGISNYLKKLIAHLDHDGS